MAKGSPKTPKRSCYPVVKDEQLAVVIRYVLHGNVYERFLSMTPLKDLSAEGIANDICQVLTRNGVNLLNCVSQTSSYDGASVMSGKHRDVHQRYHRQSSVCPLLCPLLCSPLEPSCCRYREITGLRK